MVMYWWQWDGKVWMEQEAQHMTENLVVIVVLRCVLGALHYSRNIGSLSKRVYNSRPQSYNFIYVEPCLLQ